MRGYVIDFEVMVGQDGDGEAQREEDDNCVGAEYLPVAVAALVPGLVDEEEHEE
jgi:hypothetical protein